MDKVTLKAPAKINLFLQVKDRRADGYHEIDSLIQAVSLYDEIALEKSDEIELEWRGLDGVKKENNLAYRAAKLLAGMTYVPGVRITLEKNIPAAAGLGGGSSDAAFVIRGLIRLYKLRIDKNELLKRASVLGGDIPFFLGHGQARVKGIGDIIDDYFLPLQYKILIIKPPFSINTDEAYGWLESAREHKFPLTDKKKLPLLGPRITDTRFFHLAPRFFNDFEKVIFRKNPDLHNIKISLMDQGAFYAGLSGSGSAIFGLFPPQDNLEHKLKQLHDVSTEVYLCNPVLLPPITFSEMHKA